jgi:hypothetical protein
MPSGEVERTSEFQRRAAAELQALSGRVVERGVGPLQGSIEYAEDRLGRARTKGRSEEQAREVAIRRIVRESVGKAGTTGLVTGLGGLVTMPITIPASLGGNFVINTRMVGAIAYLRGYDPADPLVQTMIQLVVAGVSIEKIAAEFGVKVGKQAVQKLAIKTAMRAIEAVPVVVIDRVSARAGYLLVIRYGPIRTAAALYKAAPIVGGLAGGAVDASFTRATGILAKKAFPSEI